MGTDAAPREPRNLRRSLAACTGDGATYAFMVGAGETYFSAFVLRLGASPEAGGLISSIPLLAGAMLQLAAPALARRVRSPRRWVILCATVQCLSFLPLVIGAITGAIPTLLVFASVSLYWAAALGAGPTWSTWVAASFPSRLLAVYFGRRNRVCQALQLAGIIVGGGVLSLTGDESIGAVGAFAAIFAAAGLSRLSSTAFLARQDDSTAGLEDLTHVRTLSLLRRLASGRELRLLTYMLIAQLTVQVSAPYFNPYMIRGLNLRSGEYLLMVASMFASKSLFLPLHGRFARRFGARRLLMLSGFGIVWLSAAWIISPSLFFLVPLQWVNGCVWGAWELATFLMMLETIPHRERTSVLTLFNLLNCAAIVVGSLIGAGLLRAFPSSTTGAYLAVFGISSALRLVSLPFLARLRHERSVPSRAVTVAAVDAAARSAPGGQGRAAIPALTGPDPHERRAMEPHS